LFLQDENFHQYNSTIFKVKGLDTINSRYLSTIMVFLL